MNTPVNAINNEKGFVLITSLLILVVVMIIGIAATNTSLLEIQISGNDRVTKEAFYASEGGVEIGAKLVEVSNPEYPEFFEDVEVVDGVDGAPDKVTYGSLTILHNDYTQLFLNPRVSPPENIDRSNPDARFSFVVSDPTETSIPRTELWVGGESVMLPGGALQQLAGYQGRGKSSGGGGMARRYDIHSITHGRNNSESWLLINWIQAL
ncbi:MAG: PilX N-terminal domain-containing pilus assembly protein [Anaerolineales bacterium]